MNDADFHMYADLLREKTPAQILGAFEKWSLKGTFMPNANDLLNCVPEELPLALKLNLKLVRDWIEPYSHEWNLHWFEYEGGQKQVRFEKKST